MLGTISTLGLCAGEDASAAKKWAQVSHICLFWAPVQGHNDDPLGTTSFQVLLHISKIGGLKCQVVEVSRVIGHQMYPNVMDDHDLVTFSTHGDDWENLYDLTFAKAPGLETCPTPASQQAEAKNVTWQDGTGWFFPPVVCWIARPQLTI